MISMGKLRATFYREVPAPFPDPVDSEEHEHLGQDALTG